MPVTAPPRPAPHSKLKLPNAIEASKCHERGLSVLLSAGFFSKSHAALAESFNLLRHVLSAGDLKNCSNFKDLRKLGIILIATCVHILY